MIVRPIDLYGMPNFLRVTIGTHEENCRFLKALEELTIVSNQILSLEMLIVRLIHVKDIPSYEIWGGNPIKKIKNRFNENEMIDARRINWEKIDKNEISDAISEFSSSNNIIKKFLS